MTIIAIDCGASFIKAARINSENESIECVKIQKTPEADDENSRIGKTVEIVAELIRKLSYDNEQINVGFSTEMHGFLIADASGKPLTDYISWQDESGYEVFQTTSYVDTVRNLLDKSLISQTGMPIKVGLPSVNLFYQLKNHICHIPQSEMFFYTLGDYVIRALSGKEPYIHVTNAAATGLINLEKRDWNREILKRLEMQEIHFPQITDGNEATECELEGRKVAFYPAIGDQQAALLGSGFIEESDVSLNYGTGAQVSILSKKLTLSEAYQTRPYFGGMYLCTVPHIPSGRALNVYFNFLKNSICEFVHVEDEDIWKYIMKEVQKDSYSSLKIDMSFFTNAVSPNTCGSISNIEETKMTVGNLFSSIYKQMARDAKDIVDRLKTEEINALIFSGGVVRKNSYLRELMLRELNVQKYTVAENETLKGICRFSKGK